MVCIVAIGMVWLYCCHRDGVVCIVGMYLIDRVAMLHCLYHLATFEVRTVLCVCVCVQRIQVVGYLSVLHIIMQACTERGAPSPLRIVLALPRAFSLTCKADIDHPMCDNNEMSAPHFMCFSPILGTILLSLFLITSTSDQLPTIMTMCTLCIQCTKS